MHGSMHQTHFIRPSKAILDAAESQDRQSDIRSVCLNTMMVEEQQKILDILTTLTNCFNIDDLKKGNNSNTRHYEQKFQRKNCFDTC